MIGDPPDVIDLPPTAVTHVVDDPVRRPLASCDPDILGVYERLVIAREGMRAFVRAALEEREVRWVAAGSRADYHLRRAQSEIEALR